MVFTSTGVRGRIYRLEHSTTQLDSSRHAAAGGHRFYAASVGSAAGSSTPLFRRHESLRVVRHRLHCALLDPGRRPIALLFDDLSPPYIDGKRIIDHDGERAVEVRGRHPAGRMARTIPASPICRASDFTIALTLGVGFPKKRAFHPRDVKPPPDAAQKPVATRPDSSRPTRSLR
jgi:hypothetical protein